MLVRSNFLSVCSKIFVFFSALMGVLLQCGLFGEKLYLSCLTYFTLMSNVAATVYYLLAAIHQAKHKTTLAPAAKGAILMCMTVTCLVYHFMLNGRFEMQGTIMISNILLHYVAPIVLVADWILFDDKGRYSVKSALCWLLAPLGYLVFVVIAVGLGAHLGPYGEAYPYFFMDPAQVGGMTNLVILYAVMGVCFFGLGMIIVGVDKFLAKKANKVQN